MSGTLGKGSANLPLFLLLLTLICALWIAFTSLYFVKESKLQDHHRSSLRPYNRNDASSNLWIVNGKSVSIHQTSDLTSQVIAIVPPESILLGELSLHDLLRVSYPTSGWTQLKKGNLIPVEALLDNPDFPLDGPEDTCSGIVSLSPASTNVDQMLSWQNQWPIGNGKFGTFVGGSYSVNIMPLSIEGFYVGPRKGEKRERRDSRMAFNLSRSQLLRGEFEASQQLLSSAIREQPMSMFQSIFDFVLLFSPAMQEMPGQVLTTERRRERPSVRSRKEILLDLQAALFGDSLSFEHGVLSQADARLFYEKNILKTREGISTSFHLLSNGEGGSVSSFNSRSWFASSVDDVIVGKLDCMSPLPDKGGCLNFFLHSTRDNQSPLPHSEQVFRISSWARRNYYSFSGFEGSLSTTPN
jgi:hypothetical protein